MSYNDILLIILWGIIASSITIGFIVCHFIIAPILISRHSKISRSQAFIWEGIQAENTLKDIQKRTDDKAVTRTLKTIKYSRYIILLAIILFFLIEISSI